MQERLQKIMAHAGVASRRKAEQLILEGQVTINGEIVTELGTKADFSKDHIKVGGKLLRPPKELIYIMLNKPKGCVTTAKDPQHRETVMDLVPIRERIYPVGRLDYNSEGLLLLTNDGEFAHRMTAPRYHVTKIYQVKVNGHLGEQQEEDFRRGIPLSGERTAPAGLRLIRQADNPWYEVRLTEGRSNQIRIMFKHFGVLVEKLKRVKVGYLELGKLGSAEFRYLSEREVDRFRRLLGMIEGAEGEATDEQPARRIARGPSHRGRGTQRRPEASQ